MAIGLSLPPAYLADSGAHRDARILRASFGDPAAGLARLAAMGISHIELRSIDHRCPVRTAIVAARRVLDAGLALALHGELPLHTRARLLPEVMPSVAIIAEMAAASQDELVVVVHPHAGRRSATFEYRESTVAVLRQIAEFSRRAPLHLRFAVELKRHQGHPDPGTCYAGIVDLCNRVGDPRVGACWDFGHAWANVGAGRDPAAAPAGFLRRVIHTHVHAMNGKGRTHCALRPSAPVLDAFARPLAEQGYGGIWNLELNPGRLASEGNVASQIEQSVACLSELLRASAAA